METESRSSFPMTTSTLLPAGEEGNDSSGDVHLGISLAISCVSIVLVPLITFCLFWMVYRMAHRRRVKKAIKDIERKRQFRRTRLKELQQQEMTEKERLDTTPKSSPKGHTRIHFGDNVTVNIQVLRVECDQPPKDFPDKFFPSARRCSSSPSVHEDFEKDFDKAHPLDALLSAKSKSASFLPSDHETTVFWGPNHYGLGEQLTEMYALLQQDGPLLDQPAGKFPGAPDRHGSSPVLDVTKMGSAEPPPGCHNQVQLCMTAAAATGAQNSCTPPQLQMPYHQRPSDDVRGQHPTSVQKTHNQCSDSNDQESLATAQVLPPTAIPIYTASHACQPSRGSNWPYLFNTNTSLGSRDAGPRPPGGRPCTLRWLSSVDLRPEMAAREEMQPLLRTGVGSKFVQRLAPLEGPAPGQGINTGTEKKTEKSGTESPTNQSASTPPSPPSGLPPPRKMSPTRPPSVDLTCLKRDPRSLTDLDSLLATVDHKHTTRLNVCRDGVLEAALRALRKPSFRPQHSLDVRFVDHSGESTSEFFRLALLEISRLDILEGPSGEKSIAYSAEALESELYRHCGCLLAMSLVHGGPSSQLFSSSAYDVIHHGTDGVMDDDLRACWQQFFIGLSSLGVLDAIRSDAEAMRPYFQSAEVPLTAYAVEAIFKSVQYSPEGSTERGKQERVVSYFRDFLVDVEEGLSTITLTDFLTYVTGSATIPVVGYSPRPTLLFSFGDTGAGTVNGPNADKSRVILTLPIVPDYTTFKQLMEAAILSDRR